MITSLLLGEASILLWAPSILLFFFFSETRNKHNKDSITLIEPLEPHPEPFFFFYVILLVGT